MPGFQNKYIIFTCTLISIYSKLLNDIWGKKKVFWNCEEVILKHENKDHLIILSKERFRFSNLKKFRLLGKL